MMTANPEKTDENVGADSTATSVAEPHRKIDREAPAGTENSLGAGSIRDGRPATKSNVVESIDEMGLGTSC